MGCSLGGCIAVHAAHQRPGLFRGAALLAPMLSLERASRHGANPYLRPLAGLISWLVPTAPIAATTRNTLYPHLQARACVGPAPSGPVASVAPLGARHQRPSGITST